MTQVTARHAAMPATQPANTSPHAAFLRLRARVGKARDVQVTETGGIITTFAVRD